jgi:hypothetical protein
MLVEEKHESIERKPSVLAAEYITHCFSVRIEFILKRIFPSNHRFQG